MTERDKTTLKRYEQSLTNKVSAIYALKEVIEELKFIDQENEEEVRTWAEEIEGKLSDATLKMDKIVATFGRNWSKRTNWKTHFVESIERNFLSRIR